MSKIFLKTSIGLLAVLVLSLAKAGAAFPAMPSLTVPAGSSGEAAIGALGSNLAAVAAHYGKTSATLQAELRRDNSLKIDSKGYLYFSCNGLAVPAGTVSSNPPVALYPLSQTFLLHSKPGSKRVIYLDFDGYTISGTQWNTDFNSGNDIVAPPWDIDGNPAVFGNNERTQIQIAWLRVAEDYAPFDVDVTTEYPGEPAITRSGTGDDVFGMRILISPIAAQIVPAGGVAYLYSFNEVGDFHKPALVFPENLANDGIYIGEACSHECGHTLSLQHQGTTTGLEYYDGQGFWAPIMGVGYYKPIVQWAKGEYLNANNTEDELALITSSGVDYRTNDFGSSLATSTLLSGTNAWTNGIIAHTGESDYFYFQSGSGAAQLVVSNWSGSSDLHEIVSVYDANGTVVTSAESVDDTNGTHGVNLAFLVRSGKYYVSITGKGSGNPSTTGYSSYASLGQYSLNVTYPAGSLTVLPAPPGPWGTNLAVFNGYDPNGAWTLFVQDDKSFDVGNIANGWSLSLVTANPVGFASDNALFVTPTNSTLLVSPGMPWNLTIAVTNYGPSVSSNVYVTDVLPAGLLPQSTSATSGSISNYGPSLVWSLGTLPVNAGATLSLNFIAGAIGVFTNTATVSSGTSDPNPDDDVVTSALAVSNPSQMPVMSAILLPLGGGFQLTVTGDALPTTIQGSTNLVNWVDLATGIPTFVYTDTSSSNYPARFYRAIVGQ